MRSTATSESVALDLKDARDLAALKGLVARADVLIQNFRPGVIEWLGLGYDDARDSIRASSTRAFRVTAKRVRGRRCRDRICSRNRYGAIAQRQRRRRAGAAGLVDRGHSGGAYPHRRHFRRAGADEPARSAHRLAVRDADHLSQRWQPCAATRGVSQRECVSGGAVWHLSYLRTAFSLWR